MDIARLCDGWRVVETFRRLFCHLPQRDLAGSEGEAEGGMGSIPRPKGLRRVPLAADRGVRAIHLHPAKGARRTVLVNSLGEGGAGQIVNAAHRVLKRTAAEGTPDPHTGLFAER